MCMAVTHVPAISLTAIVIYHHLITHDSAIMQGYVDSAHMIVADTIVGNLYYILAVSREIAWCLLRPLQSDCSCTKSFQSKGSPKGSDGTGNKAYVTGMGY